MSSETSKKNIRLTPNERAQIISEFNSGQEISNKDYYVIMSKKGVLNVRRKKEEAEKTQEKHERKRNNNYLTLKQSDNSFRIPIKNVKFDEGFLTIEQENTLFKIPAEEVKRKKKVEEQQPNIPVKEEVIEKEPEIKPKAL